MADVLPDVINAAHKKLVRAFVKRDEIDACIANYAIEGEAYEIVTQPNGAKTTRTLKKPPIDIAILAGELLYQVRSALDYLFFDLVKRNHGNGTMPDDRHIQFPLLDSPPTGYVAPIPRDKFQSASRFCLSMKAFTFIESLQPYNVGQQPSELLALLNKLSNIDKHRHLNTTVLRFDFKETVSDGAGGTSTFISGNRDDGTELPPGQHPDYMLERAVKVERRVIPRIAFDEAEISYRPEPYFFDRVIQDLPTMVYGHIIPTFNQLYLNP